MGIKMPVAIGEILASEKPDSVREDMGYKNTPQNRDQVMRTFYEIRKNLKNSQQKLPVCRIELRMNKHIYRYKFEIAQELIKTGAATLVEVIYDV